MHLKLLAASISMAALLSCSTETTTASNEPQCNTCIDSLSVLSTESLRERSYQAQVDVLDRASSSLEGGSSYLSAFTSDGLRQYARIDIPNELPSDSPAPVVVFAHGWVGLDGAPSFDFYLESEGMYGEMIQAYTDAGYVVITPGFRGHGAVSGEQAQGIEYLEDYDNGSYLSPIFYAIDVLNLTAGLASSGVISTPEGDININPDEFHLVAHSQGGDVALTALAVTGNNDSLAFGFDQASIWAGCFPDRFMQAEMYGPMASSAQAFLSGDGTWTGSAIGANGEANPHFVFAWPQDWIGTVDTQSEDWTWQADTFGKTREEAIKSRYDAMYQVLGSLVSDTAEKGLNYSVSYRDDGRALFNHPAEVEDAMLAIGGYRYPQFIEAGVNLNLSTQDYYSIPAWNNDLAERINAVGGNAMVNAYQGVNHGFRTTAHSWFTPEGTEDAISDAIAKDLALFAQ